MIDYLLFYVISIGYRYHSAPILGPTSKKRTPFEASAQFYSISFWYNFRKQYLDMKTPNTVTSILIALNVTGSAPFPAHASADILHKNAFVQNYSDFQRYVHLHKQRVTELGLALYQLYPERYQEVSLDIIVAFLKLHDQSKLQESTSQALYSFYGQNQNFADFLTRSQMQETIQRLNEYDHGAARLFFQSAGLTTDQKRLLLEIEKIADLVDRGMDPVAHEDFKGGEKYKMKLGSEYISDEFGSKAAAVLENNYVHITRNYSFIQFCSKTFQQR